MKTKDVNRRDFLKSTLGAGLALASVPLVKYAGPLDPKGLPTSILGKTGVRIPRIAVGLGSRFCNIESEEEAIAMVNYAIDHGLYYLDTAHEYFNQEKGIISEVRLGKVVKHRRKEIFLSTKVLERDPDGAKRQIEDSLKRLQTDQLDMLKIHSVQSLDDINEMSRKGHLIDIVHRMKEEGVTRFIGFSGHGNAEAMKTMAERGDFDSMLMAMNHYGSANQPEKRQELVIPAALEKGMGVMLMKVVRPKETIENIKAVDLVRFALSLKGPSGIVVGMDSMDVVKSNIRLLRHFKPMDEEEKKAVAMSISPFFRHENLEWMRHGYTDGNWA